MSNYQRVYFFFNGSRCPSISPGQRVGSGFPVDAELLTWAKQIHSMWEDEVRMILERAGRYWKSLEIHWIANPES
jgi:hypothetical protein